LAAAGLPDWMRHGFCTMEHFQQQLPQLNCCCCQRRRVEPCQVWSANWPQPNVCFWYCPHVGTIFTGKSAKLI
jgi:hypothetical protein